MKQGAWASWGLTEGWVDVDGYEAEDAMVDIEEPVVKNTESYCTHWATNWVDRALQMHSPFHTWNLLH